jgi:hypothetical protein
MTIDSEEMMMMMSNENLFMGRGRGTVQVARGTIN